MTAWRRVLKDLINYFREVQKSYEARSKTLTSASNIISNTSAPSNFLKEGGLADAVATLRDFHRIALSEANKSKDLENEVILQLTGLQSDLKQKIKEIKSLSGDFKNSVGKEQESTKKVVRTLQESLGHVDHDAGSTTGKHDPFLVKLGVDRQINKQIEEENYLHRVSTREPLLRYLLTYTGLSQLGSLGSRARVHRSRRNTKGLPSSCQHHETRG